MSGWRTFAVLITLASGCGRTAPFESSPPPASGTGGGVPGSGCSWTQGPNIDINDAFPGPFSGPAITPGAAVNAWDDAHSLNRGRFVHQSFDWHGNARPAQLVHEFSGPPNWLFTATPQEDGAVLAGWTDTSWTIGSIDVESGSFDTLVTMTPSNDSMVDLFRSDERLMIVSQDWHDAYPSRSVQFVDQGVISDKVALAESAEWFGLAWHGALDGFVVKVNPDSSLDSETTLIHLDPSAQPSRVETKLGIIVLAAARCPDGSLAIAGEDQRSTSSGAYALQVGRIGLDHQLSKAPQPLEAAEAIVGGVGPRTVGLLCTSDALLVSWEDGQWFSGLPTPGTSDGPVTDQLWFAVLSGESLDARPLLLDRRFDGNDSHPQLSLDGETVVVTWLRADRGPQNHDVLSRIDCAAQ